MTEKKIKCNRVAADVLRRLEDDKKVPEEWKTLSEKDKEEVGIFGLKCYAARVTYDVSVGLLCYECQKAPAEIHAYMRTPEGNIRMPLCRKCADKVLEEKEPRPKVEEIRTAGRMFTPFEQGMYESRADIIGNAECQMYFMRLQKMDSAIPDAVSCAISETVEELEKIALSDVDKKDDSTIGEYQRGMIFQNLRFAEDLLIEARAFGTIRRDLVSEDQEKELMGALRAVQRLKDSIAPEMSDWTRFCINKEESDDQER